MNSFPISDKDLLNIQKPAQYMGGEKNSVLKNWGEIEAKILLSFPDVYEVGMSHVGIQILYDLINSNPKALAERAYMPFPDMEKALRENKQSLYALESKRPLIDFDVIGFSLQYELCGTNILAMLELSNIPVYASDRTEEHPLIIGGGPYSYHPEPLAPFFDLFFLGDAEEFIPELIEAVAESKELSKKERKEFLLRKLEKMEGIYIPSLFIPHYKEDFTIFEMDSALSSKKQVTRRLLPTLENAPFPRRPIVPNVTTVHNRLSVEVMRGCVRGCRFCQAGYLYRPQRERSPEEIVNLIQEVLPETGFEEVSLLSLSTADYCSIVPLLKSLMDKYGEGETMAISFPSTRVDALTPEVLSQVQRVRRTSFTIAPEGGSQRLRDVINKGVTDEQIMETCNNIFTFGWTGVKLYFMIGLPTETDEDILGILALAKKLKSLESARGKEIVVSVSTHVPKPHTPFQWAEQIPPEETKRRQRIIADGLRRLGVTFRYHDAFSTFLEGIFCRGGRELAPVIERAYQLGARLDSWQEHLSQEIWMNAFKDCCLDPYFYLRERTEEEVLPWEHLNCGIDKDYFLKEYKRATREKVTPDCLKTSCSICGACNYDTKRNILWPREETERKLFGRLLSAEELLNKEVNSLGRAHTHRALTNPVERLRVRYKKVDTFKFLGHLELSHIFHRSGRRANLPIAYSQGHHPLPRFAFGPPLSLGVESRAEYVDIFLYEQIEIDLLISKFNDCLPKGIKLLSATKVPLLHASLQESLISASYTCEFIKEPKGIFTNSRPSIEQILATEIVKIKKAKKKGGRKFGVDMEVRLPLSTFLSNFNLSENRINFTILTGVGLISPSPIEIVKQLTELQLGDFILVKSDALFANNNHPNMRITVNKNKIINSPQFENQAV